MEMGEERIQGKERTGEGTGKEMRGYTGEVDGRVKRKGNKEEDRGKE